MAIECTKLCVRSSVAQAYGCLWYYKFQHMMIAVLAALPFSLAGLMGWLDPVFSTSPDLNNMPEGFNLSFAILLLTTFIWAVPVIILWHRLYLLGPEHLIRKKIWPLITRSFNVISHSLIFIGLGLVMSVLFIWGMLHLRAISSMDSMAGTITELGTGELLLYIFIGLDIFCFLLLVGLRFSMAFSAVAIGKKIGFTTSWRMTRKNTFRMLEATLLGGLPMIILLGAVMTGARVFMDIDLIAGTAPDQDMIYYFVLVTAPLLTLPVAILCSLTSTFYRHCGCAEYRAP